MGTAPDLSNRISGLVSGLVQLPVLFCAAPSYEKRNHVSQHGEAMRLLESSQSRRLRLTLSIMTLCALVGCGGGGGGGGTVVIPPVSVSALQVIPDTDATLIQYSLVSPNSHPMSVRVEISEDRGTTFKAATISQSVTGQEADPNGTPYTVSWLPAADLSSVHQGDLIVRLVPRDDVTGLDGQPVQSLPFALGPNSAPTISSIDTPAGTQGGEIMISYELSDAEGDHSTVVVEYSTNSGATWNAATIGTSGDGVNAVSSSSAGSPHTVAWDARVDAGSLVSSTIRVRLTAIDIATGSTAETSDFSVNLIAPTVRNVTIGDIPEEMNGIETFSSNGSEIDFNINVPPAHHPQGKVGGDNCATGSLS